MINQSKEGLPSSSKLLYPAFHKFYSALSSLENFSKGNDFFDNISSLDNFFSEYRNITFVLQKSLKRTAFEDTYTLLRDKFLLNDTCKWFLDKRNEVLKQHPFELEKRISIVIYSPEMTLALKAQTFTIENDVDYKTLINSLKEFLFSIRQLEVMFSAEFSFYERGTDRELYENFVLGINQMKLFLAALKDAVNQQCPLTDALESKISKLTFYNVPKNMLFVDDYVFFAKNSQFERASRAEMGLHTAQDRFPISAMDKFFEEVTDLFEKFIYMHIISFQAQKKIMPTAFIVHDDHTMRIRSFESSIKTTVYRKFYELARKVEADGIVCILFVTEMYQYDNVEEILKLESRARIKHAKRESLSFFSLNNGLIFQSYSFDVSKIDDMSYIVETIFKNKSAIGIPGFFKALEFEFRRLNGTDKT